MTWYKEKVLDDVFSTSLSLAVLVPDGMFTGTVSLWLKEPGVKAVLNPSGYYVFTDVPVDSYTLQVKRGDLVLHEQAVDLAVLDPGEPVLEVV
jgi:hypothetical protein